MTVRGIVLACSLVLAACRPPFARPHAKNCDVIRDGYGPRGDVSVAAKVVADGLEVPWGIAFLPDGRMLVTEREGRIRIIADGKLAPEPIAEVEVWDRQEGGLLGIAVDPEFATNRRFYVYATQDVGGEKQNRVLRFTLPETDVAKLDRAIVEGIPSAQYHDGGRLRFGPDGMLYASTGDARTPHRAQDVNDLGGKILRVDTDGNAPADNPWSGERAFIRGIRNSQGFDWVDDQTLFVTDHGPTFEWLLQGYDEVNVAGKGDNLGWPVRYACGAKAGMVSPVLTWEKAVPPGGAAIYTGTRIPEWQGSLLVGTLRSRHLHRVVIDPDSADVTKHEVYLRGDFGRLRDVVMGPDGELYVTTSNCDRRGDCPPEKDKVLRIEPMSEVGTP